MEVLKCPDDAGKGPDPFGELGVRLATICEWRAKFGGMDISMKSRMNELEEENRRLEKVYPEEELKAEIVAVTLKIHSEAISQT